MSGKNINLPVKAAGGASEDYNNISKSHGVKPHRLLPETVYQGIWRSIPCPASIDYSRIDKFAGACALIVGGSLGVLHADNLQRNFPSVQLKPELLAQRGEY